MYHKLIGKISSCPHMKEIQGNGGGEHFGLQSLWLIRGGGVIFKNSKSGWKYL